MANGVIVPILVLAGLLFFKISALVHLTSRKFQAALVSSGALATLVSGEPVRSCRPRRFAYLIADSEQCDKYYRCEDGNLTEQLCPDGLVYQIDGEGCFMPQWVRCGERKRLRKWNSVTMSVPKLNPLQTARIRVHYRAGAWERYVPSFERAVCNRQRMPRLPGVR